MPKLASGIMLMAPAAVTPGIASDIVERTGVHLRQPTSVGVFRAGAGSVETSSAGWRLKPASCAWSRNRLFTISPAPMTSTIARLISATTRMRLAPLAPRARRAARARIAKAGVRVDDGAAARGRETKEQAGDERDDQREGQDPRIDRDGLHAGEVRSARARGTAAAASSRAARQARCPASDSSRLSVSSWRTSRNRPAPMRGANRRARARARRFAREQQVRDVRAGDEQDERDRALHDEQHAPVASHEVIVQRVDLHVALQPVRLVVRRSRPRAGRRRPARASCPASGGRSAGESCCPGTLQEARAGPRRQRLPDRRTTPASPRRR